MAYKEEIDKLDRNQQDIRKSKRLVGGMTVLLARDFKKTLPFVPRGSCDNDLRACNKSFYLWPKIEVLFLGVNKRVHF